MQTSAPTRASISARFFRTLLTRYDQEQVPARAGMPGVFQGFRIRRHAGRGRRSLSIGPASSQKPVSVKPRKPKKPAKPGAT